MLLFSQGRQAGAGLTSEKLDGVGAEGNDRAVEAGRPADRRNDLTMTEVEAIKIAQGNGRRAAEGIEG